MSNKTKHNSKHFLICEECGRQDGTVKKRLCSYYTEIIQAFLPERGLGQWEVVCDECEEKHSNDI